MGSMRNEPRRISKLQKRREPGSFVALPVVVLRSEATARLSPKAVKLLFDLLSQFNGTSNNGDLCAAWSVMQHRGWRSRDTLSKALDELENADFITCTRQGGRNKASLYAVTFYAIDGCNGKLDVSSTERPRGDWHKGGTLLQPPPPLRFPRQKKVVRPATLGVSSMAHTDTGGVTTPQ